MFMLVTIQVYICSRMFCAYELVAILCVRKMWSWIHCDLFVHERDAPFRACQYFVFQLATLLLSVSTFDVSIARLVCG